MIPRSNTAQSACFMSIHIRAMLCFWEHPLAIKRGRSLSANRPASSALALLSAVGGSRAMRGERLITFPYRGAGADVAPDKGLFPIGWEPIELSLPDVLPAGCAPAFGWFRFFIAVFTC